MNQSTKERTQSIQTIEIFDGKIAKNNESKINSKKKKRAKSLENKVIDQNKTKKDKKNDFKISDKNDKKEKTDDKDKKSYEKNQIITIYTPNDKFSLNHSNEKNKNPNEINSKEEDKINNSYNSEKVNSEISLNKDFSLDITHNNILMNNLDENSNIYYSDNFIRENKDYKNSNISDDYNYNLNIIKLLEEMNEAKILNKEHKKEKTDIKTDDKVSIKSLSSDQSNINNPNPENIQIVRLNKFSDLNTSQSASFSINSIYENINQISKFNFQKNSDLREKTKNFILEHLNIKNSITFTKAIKNINNITKVKFNMNFNHNKITSRNKSQNLNGINFLYKSENLNRNKRTTFEFGEHKFNSHINNSKSMRRISNNESDIKNDEENKKFFSSAHSTNKNRNSLKKRQLKKQETTGEIGRTFYNKINRIKTLKKRGVTTIEVKPKKDSKCIKMNYNKLISKNIEKNQLNLNNPEEYFEGFFNDIIFNKNQDKNIWNGENLKQDE